MSLAFLFEKRFRGFRVVEIAAFLCLTALVFGVYFSKAHAGHETAEITDVDQQISQTQRRVRLLNAEVAHLESPERLESLSQQYLGLAPISAKHEAADTGLMEIARQASEPQPQGKVNSAKPVQVAKPAGAPQ
jgi:cell division protein FtsL